MPILHGTLEKTIYYNEETYFTVGRIRCDDGDLHTFTCNLPQINEDERLQLSGEWVETKYGPQLKATQCEIIAPTTTLGILRFLSSGLVKQIGPAIATKIVSKFGDQTLEIIDRDPERLVEINGISAKKAAIISESYQERRTVAKVMSFLQAHNIGPGIAAKICRKYGDMTIAVIKENPFRLAEEIHGIGFRTADKIAAATGNIAPDAPQRVRAALLYQLEQAQQEGHVFLPVGELFIRVTELCAPTAPSVDVLDAELRALAMGQIVIEQDDVHIERVYLAKLYNAEIFIANKLSTFKGYAPLKLAKITKGLSDDQARAVEQAHACGLLVITGGPGTGKTTTIKTLVELLSAQGLDVTLTAPTGRAAKRMAEATGREAKTIHRLLEYTPNGDVGRFQCNEDNPLISDVVIVDEISMVDVMLFYHLLKAIPYGCRLVMVGDADQLPSVGAGNVLRDIITSNLIPTVHLAQVFRQADASAIIRSAHLINNGQMPILDEPRSDFAFMEEAQPEDAADIIIELCAKRIPAYRGKDPLDDIQVITPMRNGILGVENLNNQLQSRLNPPSGLKTEVRYGKTTFRVGDKVMQTKNNYQKEVFNGDIGRVSRFNTDDMEMFVRFADREVEYQLPRDLDELVLSYAITVHKSQGSEYPVIILPVTAQHYIMLQRNLLYTAITRAKELAVVVGTKKALAIAVKNSEVRLRYTSLKQKLCDVIV